MFHIGAQGYKKSLRKVWGEVAYFYEKNVLFCVFKICRYLIKVKTLLVSIKLFTFAR